MKCEANFNKCKNEAKHKIRMKGTPDSWAPLLVCEEHFKIYRNDIEEVSF